MQARVGGEEWLAGLEPFLQEAGIDAALAQETVDKLRAAGATEQQLRSTTSARDLDAMGILLGPRFARNRAARRRRPCLLHATAPSGGARWLGRGGEQRALIIRLRGLLSGAYYQRLIILA